MQHDTDQHEHDEVDRLQTREVAVGDIQRPKKQQTCQHVPSENTAQHPPKGCAAVRHIHPRLSEGKQPEDNRNRIQQGRRDEGFFCAFCT
jgi:hypothetical protein